MDIFAYTSGAKIGSGIAVYKNTSTTSLSFSLATNIIESSFPLGFTNLFVSSVDIPAIDDIDNDGDLDILTFGLISPTVEYHKNLSLEKYGTCDSLDF